jgi:hypothetical protein
LQGTGLDLRESKNLKEQKMSLNIIDYLCLLLVNTYSQNDKNERKKSSD